MVDQELEGMSSSVGPEVPEDLDFASSQSLLSVHELFLFSAARSASSWS